MRPLERSFLSSARRSKIDSRDPNGAWIKFVTAALNKAGFSRVASRQYRAAATQSASSTASSAISWDNAAPPIEPDPTSSTVLAAATSPIRSSAEAHSRYGSALRGLATIHSRAASARLPGRWRRANTLSCSERTDPCPLCSTSAESMYRRMESNCPIGGSTRSRPSSADRLVGLRSRIAMNRLAAIS